MSLGYVCNILVSNMEAYNTDSNLSSASCQASDGQSNGTLPKRTARKNSRGSKISDQGTKKFLRNFDPERSEREKRKLNRRLYPGVKKHALYDENGLFLQNGEDLCDCLNRSCSGCHFPCPKCSSTKCGHECRCQRKWCYESIENEGSEVDPKNPAAHQS